MQKTTLGLTRLAPGESLSEDNFSFQDLNPEIINGLLEYAAFRHRHDAHAALAGPINPPVVDTATLGGTIPADTTIYVGYTLTDADGGETALNPDPVVVTTQGGLNTPIDGPALNHQTNAGTLVAGTYAYAITVTDAFGGETALGPAVTVTIAPGSATNRIVVSGLAALVTDSGGTGYRLWRRVNGGSWGLVATGSADTVNDDGSLCADCKNVSPPIRTGRTNATNVLKVTVPAAAPNGTATSFSIYATTDGTFGSPSLLGTYPIADLASVKTYTSLDFIDGSPPEASLTMAGAPRVNADTEVVNLRVKPPVADAAALPMADNRDGDLRVTVADHHLHVWNQGSGAWGDIATGGAPAASAHVIQDEGIALAQRANLNFVGDGVTVTDAGGTTVVTISGVVGPPGPPGGLSWAGLYDPAIDYGTGDLVRTEDAGVARLWAALTNPAVGQGPGGAPGPPPVPAFRDAPPGAVSYLPGNGAFTDPIDTMTPTWVTLVNFNSQAHAFYFDVTTAGTIDFTSEPVGTVWDAFASIWKEPNVTSGLNILATGNDEAGQQHPAFTLAVTPGRYWITFGFRGAGNSGGPQVSRVKLTPSAGAVIAPPPAPSASPWELVITATPGGGVPDGNGFSRETVAVTGTGNLAVALPRGYRLLKAVSDVAARVRLYTRADRRVADAARDVATAPTGPNHGVIVDVELDANTPATFTPAIDGWNDDDVVADNGYMNVTAAAAATVTLTVVRTEV